jgi:acetate kinase
MKILVINCGSSSLKYQLIDMQNEELLAIGLAERIGIDDSFLTHETIGKEKVVIKEDLKDHKITLGIVMNALIHPEYGAIKSMDEISATGHRVVHGGEEFTSSILITDKVISEVERCANLAPLHNPPNLLGIYAAQEILPGVPAVAVFDTAFHQTMPPEAYIYALPYELYEKHGVRRYGFHGTSHMYVARRAAEILEKPIEDLKIITCHIGNGASITAVDGGKSVDTSMGLTPLEGLVMGTRCGDIDPAIVPFVGQREDLSYQEIDNLMNKKSFQDNKPVGQKENLIRRAFSKIKTKSNQSPSIGIILGNAVKNSLNTILMVGGFITLFAVVIHMLKLLKIIDLITSIIVALFPLKISPTIIHSLIAGLFEITTGTKFVADSMGVDLSTKIAIISFIIGWSGFSVHAQVASILEDTDIKPRIYVISKILHGLSASLISYMLFPIFSNYFPISYPAYSTYQLTDPYKRFLYNCKLSIELFIAVLIGLLFLSLIIGSVLKIYNHIVRKKK